MGIHTFASQLNGKDLKKAVHEIEEWRETGVLCDGKIREISKKMIEEGLADEIQSLHMVESMILMEAALRYANE